MTKNTSAAQPDTFTETPRQVSSSRLDDIILHTITGKHDEKRRGERNHAGDFSVREVKKKKTNYEKTNTYHISVVREEKDFRRSPRFVSPVCASCSSHHRLLFPRALFTGSFLGYMYSQPAMGVRNFSKS